MEAGSSHSTFYSVKNDGNPIGLPENVPSTVTGGKFKSSQGRETSHNGWVVCFRQYAYGAARLLATL